MQKWPRLMFVRELFNPKYCVVWAWDLGRVFVCEIINPSSIVFRQIILQI